MLVVLLLLLCCSSAAAIGAGAAGVDAAAVRTLVKVKSAMLVGRAPLPVLAVLLLLQLVVLLLHRWWWCCCCCCLIPGPASLVGHRDARGRGVLARHACAAADIDAASPPQRLDLLSGPGSGRRARTAHVSSPWAHWLPHNETLPHDRGFQSRLASTRERPAGHARLCAAAFPTPSCPSLPLRPPSYCDPPPPPLLPVHLGS